MAMSTTSSKADYYAIEKLLDLSGVAAMRRVAAMRSLGEAAAIRVNRRISKHRSFDSLERGMIFPLKRRSGCHIHSRVENVEVLVVEDCHALILATQRKVLGAELLASLRQTS